MPKFTLEEIKQATGASVYTEGAGDFADVVTDTRKIRPGVLFVALRGERFNGEDFAADALQKGAAGVIVRRDCSQANLTAARTQSGGTVLQVEDTLAAYQQIARFWRAKFQLPVVAITGSNGKTTTKDLTAAVLSSLGAVQKTQGNFNNEIGLPLTLLGIGEEHRAAVVEIGMRGLRQIEALAPLAAPTVGIVTNVGETHMELLGSLENIAQAKSELVSAIPAGGAVILNADDERVAGMVTKAAEGVRVLTFGLGKGADVRGQAVRTGDGHTQFMVTYGNERHEYVMSMVGRHNVYNALAAIAAGFALGLKAEDIRKGLMNLEATKMRFECSDLGEWHIINDAYNASPMSMKAAIRTTAEMVGERGRKLAVLGDMLELGDVSERAHREVGRILSEEKFTAVITRGELGALIAEGAEASGLAAYRCGSHEEAAAKLKEILQPGDTVLFKGSRGMQMEKIIELLSEGQN